MNSTCTRLRLARCGPITWTLLLIFMVAPTAYAENKPDRQKEQVRRLQQSLKAVEEEKAKLMDEKIQLDRVAKEAVEKVTKLTNTASAATKRSGTLQAELQTKTNELLDERSKREALQVREVEQSRKLDALQKESAALRGSLELVRSQYQSCESKNLALYNYGIELMGRYQQKGVWSALVASEPFTGIKRVQIENILEEYREKLDAQRVSTAANSNSAK